jgi:hypothetical protein
MSALPVVAAAVCDSFHHVVCRSGEDLSDEDREALIAFLRTL